MTEINLASKYFIFLKNITEINCEKEVCALLFVSNNSDNFTIYNIIQVRNIKRGADTFGISKNDFEQYQNKDLIGIYHSHPVTPTLSNEDKDIFLKQDSIKIQLIGYYKKKEFCLECYSSNLKKLKINIV